MLPLQIEVTPFSDDSRARLKIKKVVIETENGVTYLVSFQNQWILNKRPVVRLANLISHPSVNNNHEYGVIHK